MQLGVELSDSELNGMMKGVREIERELKRNPARWDEFEENPFEFIKGFDIEIIRHFEFQNEIVEEFNKALRNILKKLKRVFNKCLACKITALMLLCALIGKVYGLVSITIDIVRMAASIFEKLFGRTSAEANNFFDRFNSGLENYTIEGLALAFCRLHKQCKEKA